MDEPFVLALAYLMLKHCFADFFLQTEYQWRNKGHYLHPGGLLHAAIHAALSSPVLFLVPQAQLTAGAAILLAEFVLHYHVDWTKEWLGEALSVQPNSAAFWRLIGMDQLAHNWTYVVMAWSISYFAAS